MHKFLIVACSTLALTACSSTERAATIGGVTGAVIGGTTTGSFAGAAVGGAIGTVGGAIAGELVGRYDRNPEQCVYVDRRTRERYLDDCPQG